MSSGRRTQSCGCRIRRDQPDQWIRPSFAIPGNEPQINDKTLLRRRKKRIPALLQIPDAAVKRPTRRLVWCKLFGKHSAEPVQRESNHEQ